MARPLREGSLGEPTHPACVGGAAALALPAHPACVGGRGPSVLRVPVVPPPRRHPRLSCACPGVPPPPPPLPPPQFVFYRCGTLGNPATARDEFHPTEDGNHEGPPHSGGSPGGGEGTVPNGHLPGEATGPEQELGARLRRLGDAFQQTYEQQQRERQRGGVGGVFWGHLYRLVSQLLGGVYNLRAAAN
ncbi:uncharacterized protein VSU04_015846 isoform 2-T2 [Chlamydotis macqueenii]